MPFTTFARFASFSALAIVAALGVAGCSSADASSDGSEDGNTNATTHADSYSSTVHSVYGTTTFGGPGDYQSLACGGNSRTSQPYYVASSQRYGCDVHLKLTTTAGKCIVVETEDIGPATFVETNAGMPIMDSSPTVTEYLFGESELGWSDNKGTTRYQVHVATTTDALGPCSGGGTTSSDAGTGSGGGTTTDAGSGSGTGVSCRTDGDCNPGSDGAGLICESNECVPGCHQSWQCPGSTTCQSGTCK